MGVDKRWFEQSMERQRLSQNEVARLLGIDGGALSRALNDKREMRANEIVKIASILKETPAAVLEHITVGTSVEKTSHALGFAEMNQEKLEDPAQTEKSEKAPSAELGKRRHPAFGSLKGTTIIMPGVDLTEPADPEWGNLYDE